ncbi:MAG: YARHG domain-containing protein [Gemmatimonadaceae bacterium]|nr:YARHG domain-containing protein [Gemmatimonadaceae bacterium]NUQ94907.1 YARHG domain-containing protein [Gemmatimonadaceae bacterium]NUR35259.1 YARHG domain-containing protein [Gemmatimonadaceae bacterium]NUS97852.1 YARHG domain-containing protein [Gemmatimonadaceae bacterium]
MILHRTPIFVATLALLAACGGGSGGRADTSRGARARDASSAKQPAIDPKYASMSLDELQRVRATIFGRHGRVFEDTTIQHWLETQPWYHADSGFTNARLTAEERATLDQVRGAEAARHTQIEPGDMRFYQNRVITTAMLGRHSPQDWEVLEGEVLANRGYVFYDERAYDDDEPAGHVLGNEDLQKYFEARYWYVPDPDFYAYQVGPIERQNLDTIALAIAKQVGRTVSPGMMKLFRATRLTEPMLGRVSIADLRILRNEIYALHGRSFATPWLAQHFRAQPWYKERREYSDTELSDVERANIALITAREEKLHQSLGTDSLRVSDVMGLAPDDARRLRNEIYARHGRPFADPKLRAYFRSFAWYRPDPSFGEGSLNATERFNADLISQYESGRFTEG